MRAGDLLRQIIIQSQVQTPDGMGGVTVARQAYATVLGRRFG